MPTKVYCYHVNDENKLMHICNDLMKGERDMTRVYRVGGILSTAFCNAVDGVGAIWRHI